MKMKMVAILLTGIALAPIWADGQFRIAGNTSTSVDALPTGGVGEWQQLVVPTDLSMTGWQWEVIFNNLGLGMHYGVRFDEALIESESPSEWYVDWKGDFFLSYHILGGGSTIDPFVEYGWGNVGTALVSSSGYDEFPDWEEEVARGTAVALAFHNYFAAGVAVELNGFLLGAKVSYIPTDLSGPVVEPSLERYDLAPFELSFFGGIALGGHRQQRDGHHRH